MTQGQPLTVGGEEARGAEGRSSGVGTAAEMRMGAAAAVSRFGHWPWATAMGPEWAAGRQWAAVAANRRGLGEPPRVATRRTDCSQTPLQSALSVDRGHRNRSAAVSLTAPRSDRTDGRPSVTLTRSDQWWRRQRSRSGGRGRQWRRRQHQSTVHMLSVARMRSAD